MNKRKIWSRIVLLPVLLPLAALGYLAQVMWSCIESGWLWAECDALGKTPEEMYGVNNDHH